MTEQDPSAAAAGQISAQDPGISTDRPDQATVAGELAHRQAQAGQPIGATSTDPDAIMRRLDALQAQVDAADKERRAENAPPLVGIAESARDNLQAHADANPGTDHTEALGLAGDLVDAAKAAVESMAGGQVAKLAARLETALAKVNPGPGDHHWYTQALDFVTAHLKQGLEDLEDQADQAGGSKPTGPVVSGSVVSSRPAS